MQFSAVCGCVHPYRNLNHVEQICTKVINFCGAPGAGKSTHAAALFALMKQNDMNVELVTEYAKDVTWKETPKILENQLYVFAKQQNRMHHLVGKVDYIITDSPLLLSLHYGTAPYASFRQLVKEVYDSFDNITFLVTRTKPYNPKGRSQTMEQSDEIAWKLQSLLDDNHVGYYNISSDTSTQSILNKIVRVCDERT